MKNARRHHFVPQGMSRNFCLAGNALFLCDASTGNIAQTNSRDVFVRSDFHAVEMADGSVDYNTVEGLLSDIESHGIASLNKYIAGAAIDADERYWISALWALQYLRTPIVRRAAETMMKELVGSVARLLDKEGELPPLPNALQKYGQCLSERLANGSTNIQIIPHITMLTFTVVPEILKVLFSMNWTLVQSADTDYFILSDNPYSLYDPEYIRSGTGISLFSPEIEISLPVGSNHALVGSWMRAPGCARVNGRKVKE